MSLKKFVLAATLSVASLSAQAAAPVGSFGNVPALLGSLGTLANPVLQPLLTVSAPIVGPFVATASSGPGFRILGGLISGPYNALFPPGAAASAQASGLPALAGLE